MKNKLVHIATLIVLVSATTTLGQVIPNPYSTIFHGTVTFNGVPAPVGTIVNAYDPDGVWCGTFTVGDVMDSAGIFGFMHVYGDDPWSPFVDEGAIDGDMIGFKVNGRNATVVSGDVSWEEQTSKEINLSASGNVGFMLLDFDNIKEGAPLDTVRFDLRVKNIGNGLDFYGVSSNSIHGWTTIDISTPVYADPGDTANLYFDVVVEHYGPDNVDTINFSVFSHLDPTVVMDQAFVIRNNVPDSNFSFFVNSYPNDTTASPGDTIRFDIGITNDATFYDDYYGVSPLSGSGWTTLGSQLIPIGGSSSGIAYFDLIIPQSITTLVDTITFTVFSHLNPTQSYDSSVIIMIPADSAFSFFINNYPGDTIASPSDTVRFEIGITNDGAFFEDSYSVSSVSGSGWTTVNSQLVPIAGSSSGTAYFDVIIPQSITALVDTITYTVFSHLNPTQSYDSSVIIMIPADSAFSFFINNYPGDTIASPSDTVRFGIGITNDGAFFEDSFSVSSVSGSGWTTINSQLVPISGSSSGIVYFDLIIPQSVITLADTVTYTVFSHLNPTQSYDSSVIITLQLSGGTHMTVVDTPNDTSSLEGSTVRFTLTVLNDSTTLDIYEINSSTNSGWTTIDTDSTSNSPGNTAAVSFDVVIPTDAGNSVETVSYTVSSLIDTSQHFSGTVMLTSILDTVVGLSIVTPAPDQSSQLGNTVQFTVGVYNSGNVTDTYTISLNSMTDNSWSFIPLNNVSNPVGDTALISFLVKIPDITSTTVNMISYTVTSTVDPSVSDGATVSLSTSTTDVNERQLAGLPDKFAVGQNYPNPFNPVTSIEYALPSKSDVTLEVYNLLGQQVERVAFGTKAAGNYHLEYDASLLASGVYFYRIVTEFGAETRKMVLLK